MKEGACGEVSFIGFMAGRCGVLVGVANGVFAPPAFLGENDGLARGFCGEYREAIILD